MKKLLLVLFGISALFISSKSLKVNAASEETSLEISQEVSVEESVEQSVEESVVESVEEQEETSEYTIEEFKADIEKKLADYVDQSLVAQIISWLFETGVLGALFVIYVKYKKVKSMTIEEAIEKAKIEFLSATNIKIDELKSQVKQYGKIISDLVNSNETIMKVLVLMQDKSAEGKVALLEYLGSKTNSVEVKKASEDVEQSIKAQEQEKKEINDKVKGPYEVF